MNLNINIKLYFIFLILIKESSNINQSIDLKIQGTGKQKILNDISECNRCCTYIEKEQIDTIYVNGIIQNTIDYFVYNLTQSINSVTIIFNSELTNEKVRITPR